MRVIAKHCLTCNFCRVNWILHVLQSEFIILSTARILVEILDDEGEYGELHRMSNLLEEIAFKRILGKNWVGVERTKYDVCVPPRARGDPT